MGRIQSTIGLITGLPIQDTVEQLLQVSARPRRLLVSRNQKLQQQQVAVTELTAKVLGVQFAAEKLGQESLFSSKTAASSNSASLSAAVTGEPAEGAFQFTPVRQATTHQALSDGFADADEPLGAGAFSFRFGGFIDEGLRLDDLNSGAGVSRGKIRITDRSGTSATIDLRFARTVDDVLQAINSADDIALQAVADGDSLRLIDQSGGSGNLRVQEVSGGATAADLGLSGIDVAANEASGQDILQHYGDLSLGSLNGGAGVRINDALADLEVGFRDGSSLEIDFRRLGDEGQGIEPKNEQTLGDVLDTINEADPTRLRAELSADGDAIELIDLTSGASEFSVSNLFDGHAAEDLGFVDSAAGDRITGRRILGGLKTALLSSLGGGAGLGDLGELSLTDRAGQFAIVDLSAARTLDDVIRSINAAGVSIEAAVNEARNGLALRDTSGESGELVIANTADGTETADKLQIAAGAGVASVDSGSLARQVVSENTRLDGLYGGRGVRRGIITVTSSGGLSKTFDLRQASYETIGDVIEAINDADIDVKARINDAGDGMALIDTAGGAGSLRVRDVGTGLAAHDLRLLGDAVEQDIDGELRQVVDGATTVTVQIDEGNTLSDLIDNINALDLGVSASLFQDGSGAAPNRLSLISQVAGQAGALLLDTSAANFSFQDIVSPQDALLAVGSADAGVLASSNTNTFEGVLDGVSLTVGAADQQPVTITVSASDESLVQAVSLFVEQYNALREKLDNLTFFDEASDTVGALFGSNEALRVDTELSNLVSGRFFGSGAISSLGEIGVSLRDDGALEFDASRLEAKFASDPQAVQEFFAAEETGVADRFSNLIETLAGAGSSLLVSRAQALERKIEINNERIESHTLRLERQRQRLLTQFYNMELAIGKLQNNLSSLEALQPLPPLTANSN